MGKPRIVLSGLGSKLDGLRWEFESSLRIGRQANLELVLRDYSVERVHAEIKHGGAKWFLIDLAANGRFPTLVNGVALRGGRHELRDQDILQFGQLMLRVVELELGDPLVAEQPKNVRNPWQTPVVPLAEDQAAAAQAPPWAAPASCVNLQVATRTQRTWDQALQVVAMREDAPLEGRAILNLLRANHHLSNLTTLQELLASVVSDALATLDAQRGAILLAEPGSDQLVLRAAIAPGVTNAKGYSKTLVERCFRSGESLLCQDALADETLNGARSIRRGAMASVLCMLLRTPRKRLGVLHLDRGPMQPPFSADDLCLADAMAANVAVGIECAQIVEQQRHMFLQTVNTMACAVELRDLYTGDHTRRVTEYALLLADELRVGENEKQQIRIGTPLYDIGKIGIDDAILRKPGKLTPAEFDAMKTHTLKGAAILENIGNMEAMVPIVRHHHERWDGTGYPDGLARDRISLTARIVAVADAFDAMTSHRPYRPALPTQLAYMELLSKAGSHFDPICVQAFMRLRAKIEQRLRRE